MSDQPLHSFHRSVLLLLITVILSLSGAACASFPVEEVLATVAAQELASAKPDAKATVKPRSTKTPKVTASRTRRPAATNTRKPKETKVTATPQMQGGGSPQASPLDGLPTIAMAELPREARETIRLIEQSGPFPFEKDGTVFGNREGLLPKRPQGYYREYTVITPGSRDRGARRIVAGREGELYYTDDHYDSFRRVTP